MMESHLLACLLACLFVSLSDVLTTYLPHALSVEKDAALLIGVMWRFNHDNIKFSWYTSVYYILIPPPPLGTLGVVPVLSVYGKGKGFRSCTRASSKSTLYHSASEIASSSTNHQSRNEEITRSTTRHARGHNAEKIARILKTHKLMKRRSSGSTLNYKHQTSV